MRTHWRLLAVLSAVWVIAPAIACAAAFQFEILGVSDDWLMVRENIPASPSDTTACSYPGLDPSQYVGARVHFVPLPAEAKRGRLVMLEKPANSMTLYAPERSGAGCTSASDAEKRWSEIAARAKNLGIALWATPPAALVLGAAVPAKACVLLGEAPSDRPPCRREFKHALKEGTIRIGVSLTAVPEAPDPRLCQYVGHRFGVAIQVAGLDFEKMESGVAPGGFANHYACRSQQFNPLRLYPLDRFLVVIGGFAGTSIADRDEYPFVVIVPARLTP